MGLIKEIRNEVVDEEKSLTSVLRKAKIVATSLQNGEFKHWVEAELNGYSGEDELPSYRILESPVFGTFSGPQGIAKNVQLPTSQFPDWMGENPREILFGNPIKEIESFAERNDEDLREPWPTETAMMLREKIGMRGMVLNEVYQPITTPQMEAIMDAVRNRLLEFVLELQEINPDILESEEALKKISGEEIQHVYNVTIQGDKNVVASGDRIEQKVKQGIESGDMDSLIDYLRDVGLQHEDLESLKEAIEADGEPTGDELGERVKSWLGEMTEKTYKGAINVGKGILVKAIMTYYGL